MNRERFPGLHDGWARLDGPAGTQMVAAAGRELAPRDEIVCTRLDHDANVRPWVIAAERAGATVRFAEPDPDTLELPASAVEAVLSDRTRWIPLTPPPHPGGPGPGDGGGVWGG